ncbi:MAG: hypothetical protein KDA44_07735, partial [Planctomycetales bacterium]|nr:hypothetical protein [Planctomycetales bacterium]
MTEPRISIRRQMELLNQLQQLADWRAVEEERIAGQLRENTAGAAEDFESTAQEIHERFSAQRRDLENGFAEAKQSAVAEFEKARDEAARQLAADLQRLEVEES